MQDRPPESDASYGHILTYWITKLGLSDRAIAHAVRINRTYPGKIKKGDKLPTPQIADTIRHHLVSTARAPGPYGHPPLTESERRLMDELLRTSFAREDQARRAKRPGMGHYDEREPVPAMEPTDEPAERAELLAHSPRALLTEKTGRYHNTYESWQQQEAGVDVHPSPPLHNLPFQRNPFFTGQEQLLEQLHHRLTPGSQVTLSQAISGLGGIGKTELALEYVYRYHEKYSEVLWVSASRDALLSDLILLLRDLGLELPSDKSDKDQNRTVLAAVRHWLSASSNWLLVLDNVDDLNLVTPTSTSFIPPSHHGAVLLTTQLQVTEPVALSLQVEPMLDAGGGLLVLRRTKRLIPDAPLETVSADEWLQAAELSRMLGGLPLALDQAGAYILERATTIAGYLSLYKQRHATLLQKRGSVPSAHPESVTTTFALAFERLQEKNAAAAELLQLCAFLAPDAIPEALIEAGDETHLGTVLAPVVRDRIAFDEAIEALRSLSLIQRNARKPRPLDQPAVTKELLEALQGIEHPGQPELDYGRFIPAEWKEPMIEVLQQELEDLSKQDLGVHRLVQAVLANEMSEALQRDRIGRCIRLLDFAFHSDRDRDSLSSTRYGLRRRELVPHVLRIAALKTGWEAAPTEAASLFENTADYLLRDAWEEREAESLYQYTVHIRQQTLGAHHPDTVTALKNLWLLQHYHETGHPTYPF